MPEAVAAELLQARKENRTRPGMCLEVAARVEQMCQVQVQASGAHYIVSKLKFEQGQRGTEATLAEAPRKAAATAAALTSCGRLLCEKVLLFKRKRKSERGE